MTTIEDADDDGHVDTEDNCPNDPNTGQLDADDDGIGDVCDACPDDPDNDIDGDTICGDIDSCPEVRNAGLDFDGDGTDNACDPDADNDSSPAGDDCNDLNPLVFPGAEEFSDGLDNDCDGQVDEELTAYAIQFTIESDPSNLADWLSSPGDVVAVRAEVIDSNGNLLSKQPDIELTTGPVTAYPGAYTNEPNPSLEDDVDPDLSGSPVFNLLIRDYGANIRIHAEATVDSFVARGDFNLLTDVDNDGLADKFEIDACGSLATLHAGDGDADNDGISNIDEMRGFLLGPQNLEVGGENSDPTPYDTWYQTPALVPDGPVAHFRTDPTRKDLFVRVTGYYFENYGDGPLIPDTSGTGLTYEGSFDLIANDPSGRADIDSLPDAQFALGWAFKKTGVDVHVASDDYPGTDLGALENRLVSFLVANKLTGTYLTSDGHINKIGTRDATWDIKGFSGIGGFDEEGVP